MKIDQKDIIGKNVKNSGTTDNIMLYLLNQYEIKKYVTKKRSKKCMAIAKAYEIK